MSSGAYRDDREAMRAEIEALRAEVIALRKEAIAKTRDKQPPTRRGAAKLCVACGRTTRVVQWCSDGATPYKEEPAMSPPVACTPGNRLRVGWLRRCSEPGEHLHERCENCGARWISAFASD